MPCKVGDISLNVSGGTGPNIPGFGPITAPIPFPLPNFDLPTDLVEDLLALMQQLQALFPSSIFKANLDSVMKNVLDFIANILSQISPFLSFYNFIMALLNLAICIIEVLCAIPDPIAVAHKLKKLFSECLPPFLLLFPWLALIAMILSLLLLILALLQYIIETILGIIQQIIENILVFTNAITVADAESQLAAAQKIASLLCLIENILAILIAIAAIVSIIQALAQFAGGGVCSDDDDEGCCPPEICPDFIKNNSEINVTNGTLVYHSRIGADFSSSGLPASLTSFLAETNVIRPERWQLFDNDPSPDEPISLIVTPTTNVNFGGRIFYPDQEFLADTPPERAPYTVDMTLQVDPSIFHPSDTDGYRTMVIKDCIVVRKPYIGIVPFNSTSATSNNTTGTFNLEGGLVFEDDETTPFMVGNAQATLNDFIHIDTVLANDFPLADDGYTINGVEFVWKPQHTALAGHNLITVGCFPEVSLEKAAINAFIEAEGVEAVINRLPDLANFADDVLEAQQCAQNSINKFRGDINSSTADTFQTEISACINDLIQKTTDLYCNAFLDGVSIFKSEFTLDENLQFTTRPIVVNVTLKDSGGTDIMNDIPEDCLDDITDKLKGEATFGTLSEFEYDRDNAVFVAEITADSEGAGELKILFDNEVFSTLVEGVEFETPSSVVEDVLSYEFVDAVSEPQVRRGPTDVSGDN